jgi:mannose-6-phosphate isomerase-like protein (cupin superfamily)
VDDQKRGKLFRITEDTEYVIDPPKHEKCHAYPILNPKTCPGTQFELFISEIASGGGALPDIHPDADHAYYVLSGRGIATVGDEEFQIQPGDLVYIPQGAPHSIKVLGGECYRAVVLFAPARPAVWGQG